VIEHFLRHSLPAAYSLLPPQMNSPAASAFLLSVGLQESNFLYRRQKRGGTARGLLQFERGEVIAGGRNTGGLAGVQAHAVTRAHWLRGMAALCYPTDPPAESLRVAHEAVAHNDTLTAFMGRLLLLTVPRPLPTRDDAMEGWAQYLESWNPGAARKDPKPHMKRWLINFPAAWNLVEPTS
jgi:hypothetical protein